MSFYGQEHSFQQRPAFGFPRLTPAVKTILYVNIGCFILQLFLRKSQIMERCFALWPGDFFGRFYVWQVVTATFLHGGVLHLLLNMLPLTIFGFGPGLERHIGTRRFYCVYFLCGIGGNALFLLANIKGTMPVVGASGAVCGVLAAYAMAFPERWVFLLFPPMPVKVKWLVLVFFVLEVVSEIGHGRGNIAHSAHVGGFVFGWAYMKIVYKLSLPFAWTERLKWRVRSWFASVRRPRLRSKSSARKYRPIDDGSFLDEEVDPILEKISKQGIHSLTMRERRILRRARQRMGKG